MAVPARRLPNGRPTQSRRLVPVPRRRPATNRRRRRRVPFLLFSLVLVAATLVGLVSAQALVAQDSFRVADLSAEAERLEASYGRLRLEVAELSAPDRIVAAARKAGLVLPEEVEILRLPAVTDRQQDSTGESGPALALKGVPGGER
jgi:cell division protein FtsL